MHVRLIRPILWTMLSCSIALRALVAPSAIAADSRPTTHHTLPNGMELIFIEDHSNPLAAECMWVGAGAVDETASTAGMSHFLEHLLFDGTENHSREDLQEEFERRGIYYNAFTRKEYTAHILTAPREHLMEALTLQADMLLRSTFPENELAKERKVVIEEMTRDRDNTFQYSDELFERELFRGTPLANSVLGHVSTIQNIPREEIISFYKRYYSPDRMVAIVVGDFSPPEVKAKFEELYGSLSPSEAGPVVYPPPARSETVFRGLVGSRYREEHLDTRNAYLRFGFPAPGGWEDDAPAMELASYLLVGGENARLIRKLTDGDDPPASSVDGNYSVYVGGGAWTLTVHLNDVSRAPEVQGTVADVLRSLATAGPDLEELERARHAFHVEEAFDTEHFLFYAMDLSSWMGRGGYEVRREFREDLQAVDVAAVERVVSSYLAPMKCLVHLTSPWASPAEEEIEAPERRTERLVLPNGLVLIAREDPLSQITALHVLVGHRAELEPPGLAGIGNLVCETLTEGTEKRTHDEIAAELEEMGARLEAAENPMIPFDDYYWTPDYAFLRLEVPNESAVRAAELLTDILRHPTFPEERLDAVKGKLMGLVARESASANGVGALLVREGLFGAGVWAHPIRGNPETLSRITRSELLAYHRMAFAPNNLLISVAGGAPAKEMLEVLSGGCEDAKAVELVLPQRPKLEDPLPGPSRLKREMDREQTFLAMSHRVAGFSHQDMPALTLLAGVLNRRLGLELRETQGLAYRVGAGADFTRDFGWLTLSIGTRHANVDQALEGMEQQIARVRESPVSTDELEIVMNSIWARRLRYRQRHINQAYYLGVHEYLGRGYAFGEEEGDLLRKVSPDDLLRVARRYLEPEGWITVEVGR